MGFQESLKGLDSGKLQAVSVPHVEWQGVDRCRLGQHADEFGGVRRADQQLLNLLKVSVEGDEEYESVLIAARRFPE